MNATSPLQSRPPATSQKAHSKQDNQEKTDWTPYLACAAFATTVLALGVIYTYRNQLVIKIGSTFFPRDFYDSKVRVYGQRTDKMLQICQKINEQAPENIQTICDKKIVSPYKGMTYEMYNAAKRHNATSQFLEFRRNYLKWFDDGFRILEKYAEDNNISISSSK